MNFIKYQLFSRLRYSRRHVETAIIMDLRRMLSFFSADVIRTRITEILPGSVLFMKDYGSRIWRQIERISDFYHTPVYIAYTGSFN